MKADEILNRYAEGQRNFRDEDLRGQSFKGQDLSDADFADADIRGTDFTEAILVRANFNRAKTGLQQYTAISSVIISLLLSALSGFASTLASFWIAFLVIDDLKYSLFTAIVLFLIVQSTFLFVSIRQGLLMAAGVVPGVVAAVVPLAGVLLGAGSGRPTAAGAGAGIAAVAIAGAIAAAVTGTGTGLVAAAGNRAVARSRLVTLVVVALVLVVLTAGFTAVIVATQAANPGGPSFPGARSALLATRMAAATAVAVTLLSPYIAWRSLARDENYAFVRGIAVAFACIGGTSFRNANLTDASFIQATLRSTDFRKANLTRTAWLNAQRLDLVLTGAGYLNHPKVRDLVITGEGKAENFNGLNLEGINLKGAKLADTGFVGTNLNCANLQEANLLRAKLKQTQLDGADLTGAVLTGAFIEDWGITRATRLHGIQCQYVYMRLPTRTDPEPHRKPDNNQEFFEEDDFKDFIRPIVDTLDLYHSKGVDPRAIVISFKNLTENNLEADLEIVAMEKRGRDKLLLRVQTSGTANNSELSAEYFNNYNQLKSLPADELRHLAAQLSGELLALSGTMQHLIETGAHQARVTAEKIQIQGDFNFMPEQSGINIDIGGDVTGSTLNLGEISGSVSNLVNQLPNSSDPDQPGVRELLTQLQKAIEAEAELSLEDKADLLEQVKNLAEAQQSSNQSQKEGLVRKARKMFEATLKGLPATAELVKVCSNLLPVIAKVLGTVIN